MNTSRSLALLVLVGFAACVHVPRVAPQARWGLARTWGTVAVEVSCGDEAISDGNRAGTGIMVSKRHVLTAAHVVRCASIPSVQVTYLERTGPRRVRMVVTREDAESDIARLEIASAESFSVAVVPPIVRAADPGNDVCAELALKGRPNHACGVVASDWSVAKNMETRHGDSGAPVFNQDGALVGLVIASGESTLGRAYTRISTVNDSWIQDLVPVEPGKDSDWSQPRPPMTASR